MLGQMQIPGRHLQIFMAEQKLDGAQVGARLEQVRCPAVSNQVGVTVLRMPALLAASVQARHAIALIGCSGRDGGAKGTGRTAA